VAATRRREKPFIRGAAASDGAIAPGRVGIGLVRPENQAAPLRSVPRAVARLETFSSPRTNGRANGSGLVGGDRRYRGLRPGASAVQRTLIGLPSRSGWEPSRYADTCPETSCLRRTPKKIIPTARPVENRHLREAFASTKLMEALGGERRGGEEEGERTKRRCSSWRRDTGGDPAWHRLFRLAGVPWPRYRWLGESQLDYCSTIGPREDAGLTIGMSRMTHTTRSRLCDGSV
jgi:hypothetical protein